MTDDLTEDLTEDLTVETDPPTRPRPKVTRARATTVGAATTSRRTPTKSAQIEPPDGAATAALDTLAVAPAEEIRDLTMTQGGITNANAQRIEVRQGGISQASAASIDVWQGGIAQAQATDIAVTQGGIALARGERVSVEMGGVALMIARDARLSQGGAQTVLARDVHVEQGIVGTVVANNVTVARPSLVGLVLARNVHGEVRAILDWRGALAFGAVAGVLMGILRRRR